MSEEGRRSGGRSIGVGDGREVRDEDRVVWETERDLCDYTTIDSFAVYSFTHCHRSRINV